MKFKDFKKLNIEEVVDLITYEDVEIINKIEEETGDDLPLKFYAESYIDVVDLARFKDNEEVFSIKEYLESYLEDIINLKNVYDLKKIGR